MLDENSSPSRYYRQKPHNYAKTIKSANCHDFQFGVIYLSASNLLTLRELKTNHVNFISGVSDKNYIKGPYTLRNAGVIFSSEPDLT